MNGKKCLGQSAVLLVGVETLCLAWVFILAFQYQWLIADYLLATGVIFGLTMMRPLAMYARDRASAAGTSGGHMALGLGVLGGGITTGLMYGNYLPNAEVALHTAAIIAGLFIIYELVVTGFERGTTGWLGERGGYLAGIVVLSFVVCIVAALMDPVAFEYERWRWFAVLIPAMVWFGDVLVCVRQSGTGSLGDVVDDEGRRRALEEYLRGMSRAMPQTNLKLVLFWHNRAVVVSLLGTEITIGSASRPMHDAISILIQENARVPLPDGVDRQSHPMGGIAQTMHMAMALRLSPPPGAIVIEDLEVVLVGQHEVRVGDVPSYASSETLDLAQKQMTNSVWAATLLEGMPAFALEAGVQEAKAIADEARTERARMEEEVEGLLERVTELEERVVILREDRTALAGRQELMSVVHPMSGPPLARCRELLEPELIEGLSYLLQTDEPFLLSGAMGGGKGFVARCAHLLGGGKEDEFFALDCADEQAEDKISNLLGLGSAGENLLEHARGATILLRSAEHLGDEAITLLCAEAKRSGTRLVFAFHGADAELRSPLEGRGEEMEALLGHREVVIPSLAKRQTILREVLMHWLTESARRRVKHIDGFSRMAMEALEVYPFPGQMTEAQYVVDQAVQKAEHDVIDLEDLSYEVQADRR
ncbi:MAG: hypothetical protein ACNA8W_18385 [Bradymonadaceae bacterium]